MNQCYVYKWTHLPTRSWYVGSRTAKGCHPGDGYICSSKTVKPLIQNAPNQWQREIVATGDQASMMTLELEILDAVDALRDPRSLNRSVGLPRGIAGVPKSDQHKQKIRSAIVGRRHTESARNKMKNARKQQAPYFHTEETKVRIALSHQDRPKMKTTCPHCGRTGGHPAMTRWHFDKCHSLVSVNPNVLTTQGSV